MVKIFKKIDHLVESIANAGLVICVSGMLFFGLATIVLRWIGQSVLWMDPLVRHLVFLSAFLGGALATGKKQHIAIDVLGKYLEGKKLTKYQKQLHGILGLFCTLILGWLAYGSIAFVKDTYEFEGIVFLGIHRSVLVAIIPFGLGLMMLRFFYIFLDAFSSAETSTGNSTAAETKSGEEL